jgi:ADP-dependent phosphofructokinase/glucokinase
MSSKITLGMGDNVDYEIIWSSIIFEDLIIKYDIKDQELNTIQNVKTERDLVISILSFLKLEKGGEVHVYDLSVIDAFSNNFRKKITLGGTSVRAAIAMAKLDYSSNLHLVTMNDYVRQLLPPTSKYICSCRQENVYPHLIVQYNRGTLVNAGDIHIETSRANRIIYVNDPENEIMEISDDFKNLVVNSDIILISGFNAMHDKSLFKKRLQKLDLMLEAKSPSCKIFYEDACYHNADYSLLLHKILMSKIDIYSLNEDEMSNYLKTDIDLLNPEQIVSALKQLRSFITANTIVIHTRYWALAYGDQAESFEDALRGGVCMSNTRFRLGDDYTEADYLKTASLPVEQEGSVFSTMIKKILKTEVCCIPTYDIKTTKATTIGLGDSFVGGFIPHIK